MWGCSSRITLFPLLAVVVDLAAARQLRHRQPDPDRDQPGALEARAWHLPTRPPTAASVQPPFPVLTVAVELHQDRHPRRRFLIVAISTTAAYAFARLQAFSFKQARAQRHAAAADVPAGTGAGGHLRDLRDHRQPYMPWHSASRRMPAWCWPIWAASPRTCVDHQGLLRDHPGGDRGDAPRSTAPRTGRPSRRVLLPMAVPILMVVFVLAFIGTIIEYPVASHPAARGKPTSPSRSAPSTSCMTSASCGATSPLRRCLSGPADHGWSSCSPSAGSSPA